MKRLVALVSLAATVSACGSSSTSPTPTPPAAVTRIITVSGNLAFGSVNIGESPTRTFTISNSGNATLTFTSLSAAGGTGATGYAATPTSGSVSPGGSLTVTLRFTPPAALFYSHVLSVVGDQTSGGAAINVSGSGVNPNPIFALSGTGDNVFTIPSYVARIRVTGDYTRNSSNFIVYVNSRLLVNELIGTGWNSTHFEGTYLTTGGVTEIRSSSGVAWTFTEVR